MVVGCVTAIVLTAERLPERVASHFDAGGVANGFMTRELYLAIVLALVVLLPALVAVLITTSMRHDPPRLNLPNRDYWLAPERRRATTDYLAAHAAWLAALVALLAVAVHLLVIRANRLDPPHLDAAPFLTVLLCFAVAIALWIAALLRRFTPP